VADRVFIGDKDGTLWRLNFASATGKPSEWNVDLFFDGFPSPDPFLFAAMNGQPVTAAPIISVDKTGNLTIAFSTGEQEAVGASNDLPNFVWSLTEKPNADRTKLTPKPNWYLALKGDRAVGEVALCSEDLFFATVGPGDASNACNSGSSKVWGMNYLTANTGGVGKGGAPATTLSAHVNTSGFVDATEIFGSDAHAYLSGVSVSQQPSCDSAGTAGEDAFFNYGVQPAAGTVTPGKFQLWIPTGDKTSTSTKAGINVVKDGGSNGVAIDLTAPKVLNIVDSWAAIVE
jgi:type IV pilus assembly protein PilY1